MSTYHLIVMNCSVSVLRINANGNEKLKRTRVAKL
jgi:hypothetical protein